MRIASAEHCSEMQDLTNSNTAYIAFQREINNEAINYSRAPQSAQTANKCV